MREILFRGKRMDNGEWVEGSLVHRTQFYGDPDDCYFILYDGEFHCDYYGSAEVDFKTVGQYTGLTDKNGKKIFEGDIVKDIWRNYIELVEYNGGGFNPFAIPNWECTPDPDGTVIIGNIHDTPELLRGGAE